jgi:hypothetical protein
LRAVFVKRYLNTKEKIIEYYIHKK